MISISIAKILIFLICNLSFLSLSNLSFVNNFTEVNLSNQIEIRESQLLKNYLQKEDNQQPVVSADKYLVLDSVNNIVLYEKNSLELQAIASITKLMTALVALDLNPDWDEVYEISRNDRREGGRIYLYLGDRVELRDLFELSLVGSANTATFALVNSLGFSKEEYVDLMNSKAKELGLKNTSFADVTGLSVDNISNAREIAILTQEALARPEIQKVVEKGILTLETKQGRKLKIESTDSLLTKDLGLELKGGKTGYLPEAGYCFSAKFNKGDEEIITVVLNAESLSDRFNDTLNLVNWSYNINLE